MSTTTITRTNLCLNPSFEMDLSNWPGTTGSTNTTTSAQAYVGTSCAQITMSATSTVRFYSPTGVNGIPVTPGLSYVFSAYVMAATTGNSCTAEILWYNAAGTNISSSVAGAVTDTTTWTQYSIQAVAPANAATATMELFWTTGVVGQVHYVDAVMFQQATSAGTYFDGGTPNAAGPGGHNPPATYSYMWLGVPNVSASVEVLTIPMQAYQLAMPNGTILGNGTGVELSSISGLLDKPGTRQGDAPRGQRDGSIPGLNFVGERVVTVNYQITQVPGLTETYRAMASAAHQNVQDPSTICLTGGDYLRQYAGIGTMKPVYDVQVQLPNRAVPLMFFGRPTGYNSPVDQNYGYGQISIVSQWTCPDGLLYDAIPASASCGLANPTTGATFPLTFPLSFGSSVGGSLQITNAGKYYANPFFVIHGPCNTPTIQNLVTGQQIQLNMVLAASDVVTVDTQSGVVTLNGTANRNNAVDISTTMFTIPAGTASIGFSSIDSVAVNATLTAYVLPTYDAA